MAVQELFMNATVTGILVASLILVRRRWRP